MRVNKTLKVCGVYDIRNKVNEFSYIGSSKSIYKRISEHFSMLRGNRHTNLHLQNAYNVYGEGVFEVLIREECSLEELHKREEYFISITPNKYNFNLKPSGPLRLPYSTEERKEKVRIALTGRKRTKEQIQRFSESHMGLKQSEESKQKKSKALIEFYSLEENRMAQSEHGKIGSKKMWEKFLLEHPDGRKIKWIIKKCLQCDIEFEIQPHRTKKFCSRKCNYNFQKGKIPWNKGLKKGDTNAN